MNKKLVNDIRKTLNKISINIKEEFTNNEGFFFMCDGVVINITKDDLVKLSYHVATRPDYASNLSLALCELPDLDKVEVLDLFAFDKNEKLLTGDDAIKYYFENMRDHLIQQFMKDQYHKYILHTSKPYTC